MKIFKPKMHQSCEVHLSTSQLYLLFPNFLEIMKTILSIVAIIGFLALCKAAPAEDKKVVDYDVYMIRSKLITDGVLTVNIRPENQSDIPRLAIWNDDAGQKWRLESSHLYSAFQLRPTSYESFVLEQDDSRNSVLSWVASFGQFGRQKLWYLYDAGSGFTQIKNKHYDTCLTFAGLGQEIRADPCTNGADQQWSLVKLSQ